MAYSTTNPPKLMWGSLTRAQVTDAAGTAQGTDGKGVNFWQYVSTDAAAVVRVDGFFTDGFKLGLRRGDVMWVVERVSGGATTLVTTHTVSRSTATGGCDLSDETALTTVTDSD